MKRVTLFAAMLAVSMNATAQSYGTIHDYRGHQIGTINTYGNTSTVHDYRGRTVGTIHTYETPTYQTDYSGMFKGIGDAIVEAMENQENSTDYHPVVPQKSIDVLLGYE